MKLYDVCISFDPGYKGAICIIKDDIPSVYPMPILEDKKGKRKYDLISIVNLLKLFVGLNVISSVELVHSMPMEGSTSSFGFGRGFGNIEGILTALFNKEPFLISPQAWKKHFTELETLSMIKYREQIKKLREKSKTIKEKVEKKENKKEIEKLGRKLKSEAKDQSRFLAAKLCPLLADKFELKKNDGLAEALLIALFTTEKYGK
jgi:hypothetical protein